MKTAKRQCKPSLGQMKYTKLTEYCGACGQPLWEAEDKKGNFSVVCRHCTTRKVFVGTTAE